MPITDIETLDHSDLNDAAFLFHPTLDQAFLNSNYGANLGFAKKMFSVFLVSTPKDIESLNAAVEANDIPNIQALAHKIKNNFTWVGLTQLGLLMKEVENMAKQNEVCISKFYIEVLELYQKQLLVIEKETQRLTDHLS